MKLKLSNLRTNQQTLFTNFSTLVSAQDSGFLTVEGLSSAIIETIESVVLNCNKHALELWVQKHINKHAHTNLCSLLNEKRFLLTEDPIEVIREARLELTIRLHYGCDDINLEINQLVLWNQGKPFFATSKQASFKFDQFPVERLDGETVFEEEIPLWVNEITFENKNTVSVCSNVVDRKWMNSGVKHLITAARTECLLVSGIFPFTWELVLERMAKETGLWKNVETYHRIGITLSETAKSNNLIAYRLEITSTPPQSPETVVASCIMVLDSDNLNEGPCFTTYRLV